MSVQSISEEDFSSQSTPRILQDSQPGSERPESPSAVERFIHNFLREQNIRWMLVIGAGIIFASSLMLIGRSFSSWRPELKCLTIVGYTAVIYGAAEVARARLGLRATSNVMQVLTLLLFPVCFLSMSWQASSGVAGSALSIAAAIALGVPLAAFLWFASSRIFDRLLYGRQTTYVISYALLSIAGLLPEITHPLLGFAVSLTLWAAMTVGTLKVNRHLFWLAEEHRWPRVVAFFPAMLLGVLFLLVEYFSAGRALSLEWIGFGCVLVSATILMTVSTIADVYRKRTGDLIRPWPWSIALPLLAGLIWMTVGLGLAFTGFPRTFAIVPSLLLATGILIEAARQTGHRGFVWAALLTGVLAYNSCPSLFLETAVAFRNAAAAGLQVKKLPFAFYGLTYLPLIVGTALLYRGLQHRVRISLLAPLRTFSCGLAVFLQCIAITNPQALFLVSSANVLTFFVLGLTLKDRRIGSISLISMVIAVAMAVPFFDAGSGEMSFTQLIAGHLTSVMTSLGLLGAFLSITGFADRLLKLIPENSAGESSQSDSLHRNAGQSLGLVLTAAVSAYFLASNVLTRIGATSLPISLWHGLLPAVTFFVQTVRRRNYQSGCVFWTLVLVGAITAAMDAGFSVHSVHLATITALATISVAVRLLPEGRKFTSDESPLWQAFVAPLHHANGLLADCNAATVARAFLLPLDRLCLSLLVVGACVVHLPAMCYHALFQSQISDPAACTIVVVWLLAATFLFRSRVAGVLSGIALPLLTSSLVAVFLSSGGLSWNVMLVIWAAVSTACFVLFRKSDSAAAAGSASVSRVWMLATLGLSTVSFDVEYRLVPLIVVPVLFSLTRSGLLRTSFAILLNIHVLLFVSGLAGQTGLIGSLLKSPAPLVLQLLFPSLVASVIFFFAFARRLDKDLAETWIILLRVFAGLTAFTTLFDRVELPTVAALMVVAFIAASIVELFHAIRSQRELYVWLAAGVLAAGGIWTTAHGIIQPGTGKSQFLLLLVSVAALTVAEKSQSMKDARILARPLRTIGLALPLIVLLMALIRSAIPGLSDLRGLQAMAVFASAAVYFQQWMRTGKKVLLLLAGAIVNVAFVLLWRHLQLSDAQFYLVPMGLSVLGLIELMKTELPEKSHEPIRYIGALMILVSPVFDILGGSWLHMMSLLLLSTLVVLLSIGLRLRALMFTGSAFIVADLAGMVFRATVDRPALLWVGGLLLGGTVIGLAAFCENHREQVLSRIRKLSAVLSAWD